MKCLTFKVYEMWLLLSGALEATRVVSIRILLIEGGLEERVGEVVNIRLYRGHPGLQELRGGVDKRLHPLCCLPVLVDELPSLPYLLCLQHLDLLRVDYHLALVVLL